jgi:hypothetical protein
MGRIGWKGGRFNVDYETSEIYRGLRDWQRWTGDKVNYFRFAYDQSSVDPTYKEAATTNGRIYFGPNLVPALHVIHVEGDNQNGIEGFYYNDEVHVTMSFDQINRLGIGAQNITTQTQNYLKDRVEYRGKIYRVTNIQILGQIQRKPIIITIDASQVKPEEMVNDIQFAQYAQDAVFPLGYKPDNIMPAPMTKELRQVFPQINGPVPSIQEPYGDGPYSDGPYGG